jgi:hypothetical protein
MKINFFHWPALVVAMLAVVGATASVGAAEVPDPVPGHFIVHEWGTFTSVQGGDGRLLPWRPLLSSPLPGFVHNWAVPGLNVSHTSRGLISKGGLVTLQRMETPVIYFYSDKIMAADVSVSFPAGLLTEWYPQPTQIGPAAMPIQTNAAAAASDGSLRDSRIVWRHLTLTPASMAGLQPAALPPMDPQGPHYFAARETGSDYVQTDPAGQPDGTNETEKFLFYRGAGSFTTPLLVTVDGQNHTVVANTGTNPLAHLFLVRVQDGCGAFRPLASLAAGQSETLAGEAAAGWKRTPLARFQTDISAAMVTALTAEGLFEPEAQAMVHTWQDSWFTEEGTRVLYILPRSWTDEILPLTLAPEPERLVRVMVGRAELITPTVQAGLLENLTRAQEGDAAARRAASHTFTQLGRFAWPALGLALGDYNTNAVAQLGYSLMLEASRR